MKKGSNNPSTVRQRRNARSQSDSGTSGDGTGQGQTTGPPTGTASPPSAIWERARPILLTCAKGAGGGLLGLACATSMSDDRVAIGLFLLTVFAMLFVLVLVFRSIYSQHDDTVIHLPTIHNSDGTTTQQDSLTYFEHDKRFATYYSSEFPAFAIATAWFYLWTQWRFVVPLYTAYIVYRIATHPLFRVHVWNVPYTPDLARPFGTAPLFTAESKRVTIVEGVQMFDAAIDLAPADQLVVVDVSATWCPPCKVLAPVFRALADEFESCSFVTVDVDVSRDVAEKLEITSVPSFFFFKNGERLEFIRGGTETELRAAIARHS